MQLMDDDGDMAEMYLREKKRRMELNLYGDQFLMEYKSVDGARSISAPVSPVSSPPSSRKLEKHLKEHIDNTKDFINIKLRLFKYKRLMPI
ncbi:hypothetical protein Droror1_Dr00020206 [Drosera rotundifolia]